jgi:hypothetical protein
MNALAMNVPLLTAWWLTQDTPIVAVYCLMGDSLGEGVTAASAVRVSFSKSREEE